MPPQDPLNPVTPPQNPDQPSPPEPAAPSPGPGVIAQPPPDTATNVTQPENSSAGVVSPQPIVSSQPQQPTTFQPAPAPIAGVNSSGKLAKIKKIIILLVIVGIVGAGGLFAAQKFLLGNIKLEAYSNDDFSLQVPVGYEKEESPTGVEFKEKGDKDTASGIIAFYDKFPRSLGADRLNEIKDLMRQQLQMAAENFAEDGEVAENIEMKDVKHNGKDALQLTATIKKDGKKSGDVKLVAVITSDEMFIIGIGAHSSDPGLSKKIDTIINSFEIK